MHTTGVRSHDGPTERAPTRKFTLVLPDYVKQGLQVMAADENTTVKKLVLEAINSCLVKVHPVDMEDQRGTFMKMVAKEYSGRRR